MRTYAICPINNKKVDEHVARVNAAITVLLLIGFVAGGSPLIVLFLLADFLLRGFDLAVYSPIAIVSRRLVSGLSLKPKVINAGPKFFAAKVGALFSFAILLSTLLQWHQLTIVFSAVFGICAFLEAAVGFCLACKIYPYTYKLTRLFPQQTIR